MEIPFTTEQFFEIIEKYNLSTFPLPLIIFGLGILSVVVLHLKIKSVNKLLGAVLGFLWLWTGLVYHLAYFTEINKAAFVFGGFFVLQGLIFLAETFYRKKLEFEFKGTVTDYIAYFFIIFGVIIYPALIYIFENSLSKIITLGLPCPSTIFTFGFLMLTTSGFSKYVLIIPVLWTIVGTTASYNFGVYPDYMMLVSALTASTYLILRKKE